MAEPPEDPRMLLAQLELVQRQLQRSERRLEALQGALVETSQAAATLRGLAESAGAREALVPVGAGVHVRATVDSKAAVLRPLGAGYAIDAPAAEAQAELESRAQQLQRSFQEAGAEANRLADTAAILQERLASLSPQDP